MKSKILATFAATTPNFDNKNANKIYIMDYSHQTNKKRSVEWSNVVPTDIDAFFINNSALLDITFCVFQENTKITGKKEDVSHCEGVLFPTKNSDKTWISFLELKYPDKIKNLSSYLKDAREQLLFTLDLFREQGIIEENRLVYLMFSAPKYSNKTPFESWCLTTEYLKNIKKTKFAIMRGVNNLQVISEENLKV
jgi:hypothetical protein